MTRATVRTSAAVSPTPTAQVVDAARKTAEVTDARGRKIAFRKLGALAKVDLYDIVGAKRATNPGVIGTAASAFAVTHIDGQPVLPPSGWLELRNLIDRLDDDGLEAVGRGMIEQGWVEMPKPNEDEDETLKN